MQVDLDKWQEFIAARLDLMDDHDKQNYWPHTLTLKRVRKEDPKNETAIKVLKKILDEAALTQHQGGALNYNWMLDCLDREVNGYE